MLFRSIALVALAKNHARLIAISDLRHEVSKTHNPQSLFLAALAKMPLAERNRMFIFGVDQGSNEDAIFSGVLPLIDHVYMLESLEDFMAAVR